MNLKKFVGAACLVLLGASTSHAGVVTLTPDFAYWNSVGPTDTSIYANSFVADESGVVTQLGTWLTNGTANLVFEILNSKPAGISAGPDSSAVLATTGNVVTGNPTSLTFVDGGTVTSLASLIAGETYWFAINAIGQTGSGYTVGGHTQGSAGAWDTGSFWFSNDSSGVNFDGQNYTPEMAFSVTISPAGNNDVPEPGSLVLVGLGLVGLAAMRRKAA